MQRDLATMTWKEAQEAITPDRPIILPLGSTEQHGPHLPLSVDSILAEEWARRLAERVDALHAPVMPFGQVWSARAFAGTISLQPATLEGVIFDVAESLHRHGARRLVLLSGHMGNSQVIQSAARRLYESFRDLAVVWIVYPAAKEVAKGVTDTPFWNGTNFHAAEVETSLMLAVAPEHCRMDEAPREYPTVPAGYDSRPIPWDAFSETGVFGDATAATAEKGAALISRWLEVMTRIVHESFDDAGSS